MDEALVTGHEWLIDKDVLCDHLLRQMCPVSVYRGSCIKLIWLDISCKTPQHMR
jgi:hypothetical protein